VPPEQELAVEAELDRVVDRYVTTIVEDNPVLATHLGVHSLDGELGDVSAEGMEEKARHLRSILLELSGLDLERASTDAQIDAAVLRAALARSLFEYDELRLHERMPAVYVRTALSGCHSLLARDFAPLVERVRSLVSRLLQIPEVMECARRNVRRPPRVFAQVAAELALRGARFVGEVIPPLQEELGILRRELGTAGAVASRALEDAATHFAALASESDARFAVGRERFEWILREVHLLDLDSGELLEYGIDALVAAEASMERAGSEIDPGRSWRDVVESVRSEHPPPEGLRGYYASQMEKAREFVRERDLVTVPEDESLEVVDTPEFLRGILPFAAYSPPGPFEKRQQGLFYVTPVDPATPAEEQERLLRGHATSSIPIIALHEGYPGHHLQFVRSNAVPRTARKLTWNSVFIEGWALYCEDMMREEGFYSDARTRLCQLGATLWRAARVVVDVGLQRGEMSIEEAVDFMVDRAGLVRDHAWAEVKRYACNPTQPSSYLVGKRAILDLKSRFERASGAGFSVKEFHDRLLDVGSVPPSLAGRALGITG